MAGVHGPRSLADRPQLELERRGSRRRRASRGCRSSRAASTARRRGRARSSGSPAWKGSWRGATGSARRPMPGSCRLTRSRMRSTGPILICAGKRWRSCSAGICALTASTKLAAAHQLEVGDDGGAHAVAAVDQLDLHRVALEHRRQHAAQRRRSPARSSARRSSWRYGGNSAGRRALAGEGRQVAGELQAVAVELAAGAAFGAGGVLAQHRLGAVERLQHQEVGHLRDAVAQLAHARGERLRALLRSGRAAASRAPTAARSRRCATCGAM